MCQSYAYVVRDTQTGKDVASAIVRSLPFARARLIRAQLAAIRDRRNALARDPERFRLVTL
ncbi:MAG: hypothetical protein WC565_08015 [Parcubacteria group bacterium]